MPSIFKNFQAADTTPEVEIIEDGFKLGAPTPTEPQVIEQQEATPEQIEHNLKNGVVLTEVREEYSPQSLENLETLAAAAKSYLEQNADVAQQVARMISGLGQISILTSTFSVSAQREINRLNALLNRYKATFGELVAEEEAVGVPEVTAESEQVLFAPTLSKSEEEGGKPKVLLPSQVVTRLLKAIQGKFPEDRRTDYGVSSSAPDFDANVVAVINKSVLVHIADICKHITERAQRSGMFFTNNTTDGDFGLVVYSDSLLLIVPNLLNVHQYTFVNIDTKETIKLKMEAQLEAIEKVISSS